MKVFNLKNVVLFICMVFAFFQFNQVLAFSVRDLLGLGKSDQETAEENKAKQKSSDSNTSKDNEWAKSSAEQAATTSSHLDIDYITLLIANMNEQDRSKVLSEPKVFKQLIENEANSRAAVSAAIANKLEQDRNVEFLMRRGAENILRESYLTLLIADKLPTDFPNSKQIEEYYTSNKGQLALSKRVHVSQIFFSRPKDADVKQIASIKKKANKILSQLKKGTANFSSVALSESEHEPSKALGGFMGILKIDDLLPELKQSILQLKEGELTGLIESRSGFHIMKRGEILKAESIELSQVESQIRQLLINQTNLQLSDAIYNQARKKFPQNISDEKIEEWRLRLKTNTVK